MNNEQLEAGLASDLNRELDLITAGYTRFDAKNPPPHGYYLCVGHAKTRFICLMSRGIWYRQSGSKQVVGITHWMEIP